jgi:hypothetical protein
VQSIEGARACLGAFFNILLDVNVTKRQLENSLSSCEASVVNLTSQISEMKQFQLANEISF